MKAYHCTATDCSTGAAVTLDSTGDVGTYTSIAVGTGLNPVISYYYAPSQDLKVIEMNSTVTGIVFN